MRYLGTREKTGIPVEEEWVSSFISVCSSLEGVKKPELPPVQEFQKWNWNTSFLENLIFLDKKWLQRKNVLNTKDVFFYSLQFLLEIFFEIPIIYENKWKKP